MKIERQKNASRNIVFGILSKLYQIFLPFLMRTLMIYFMGVQYLGLNSLFTSILQVLNLAELGVGSAMVYSMYKPIADDDVDKICALMNLYRKYYFFIGLVIAIIGGCLTPFIPNLISDRLPEELNIYVLYILHLSVTVLSYWLFSYKNCLFNAYQRVDITSKISMALSTVQYVLQIATILILKNYYVYIIIMLLTQITSNIVTAIIADKKYPLLCPKGHLNKLEIKKLNEKIRDLFTAKLGAVVVGAADTVVISAFLGLAILAVYQNYYFIINSVCGFISVLFSAVVAGIGNSLVTESQEKNYEDFKKMTFIICWILNVCTCCFLGLFQPFIKNWVGEGLMLSFGHVILFCVYFYVCELAMIWATVKDAAGLWHEDRYRPLIGAVCNLVLNLILVNHIGLYGIMLSTILSYLLISMPWLIYNLFRYLYKKSLKKYLISIFQYAISTIVTGTVSIVFCQLIDFEGWGAIIINGFICVLVSNIIQFLLFNKKEEFQETVHLVKNVVIH